MTNIEAVPKSRLKNMIFGAGKWTLRTATTLVLVLAIALGVISTIVGTFGSLANYYQWSQDHQFLLTCWRITIYVTLILIWQPTRKRLREVENGKMRLIRCEAMAIAAISIYELQRALMH